MGGCHPVHGAHESIIAGNFLIINRRFPGWLYNGSTRYNVTAMSRRHKKAREPA